MTKKEIEQYKKYGLIAAGLYVGYKLIKPMAAASGTLGSVIATKTENQAIKATTGLSESEIQLCRDVASKLNLAMYDRTSFWSMSWFGGSLENEKEVVNQLNRLHTGEHASVVSDFYTTVTGGQRLAYDVNAHLEGTDIMKIKPTIYSNLH